MSTEPNSALDNAKGWAEAISETVVALRCDYDRLEELTGTDIEELSDEDKEELTRLQDEAGDVGSWDEAITRIEESALSIEVRSGWTAPGDPLEAEEFQIVLTMGGPALRIVGELMQGQVSMCSPDSLGLEYRDWGTGWAQYSHIDPDTLLEFCNCFSFGE